MLHAEPSAVPPRLVVDRHTVDLVDIDLAADSGAFHEILCCQDERARAARLLDPGQRARFVVGRATLRAVLGAVLDVSPRDVRLERGARGKPKLSAEHGVDVRFNVSHSAGRGVLAVTLAREVGVDLERLRSDLDVLDIARRFFAPGESAAIEALPPPGVDPGLLPVLDEQGIVPEGPRGGAAGSPGHVRGRAGWAPAHLLWSALESADVFRWHLMQFDPGPGYVGALTVEGPPPTVRCWHTSSVTELRRAFVT